MNKPYFTALARYTAWADSKVMYWLNQIDDGQWNMKLNSSFGSVRETVMHIVSAEKIWIDFWEQDPEANYLSQTFKGTKNDLMEIWQSASVGILDFIEALPEDSYDRQIGFRYPDGRQASLEFWQTFSHLHNHSTYHRGQLVTLLRQVGFTGLSSIDLITYFIANQKK